MPGVVLVRGAHYRRATPRANVYSPLVDGEGLASCPDAPLHLGDAVDQVGIGPFRLFAESARGVSPRAAHRSGRDTLASSGSCHRTKTAAFRRERGIFLLPVGPLPTS